MEESVCVAEAIDSYSFGLHFGAIFIICGVSILGYVLPMALIAAPGNGTVSHFRIDGRSEYLERKGEGREADTIGKPRKQGADGVSVRM